jgi:hypothetical protein
MTLDANDPAAPPADGDEPPRKPLSPAAARALAEAAERRAARDAAAAAAVTPTEYGGQQGPDPARYGDWEKGGIVSDF